MKKILTILVLLVLATRLAWCQDKTDNSWLPTPSWPFIYNDFEHCIVHTMDGKTLNVTGNIHIYNNYLWYKSATGKYLLAKEGTVKDVLFKDGSKYIEHHDKLLKVLSEDTVGDKKYKLLQLFELDKVQYDEDVRNKRVAERSSMIDIAGLNAMNLDMSVRESANISEQEPLPTKNIFYIQMNDDVFEATESNITKHLANKEERTAYRAYTRKAEIITGDLRSAINIYTTFFLKKQ